MGIKKAATVTRVVATGLNLERPQGRVRVKQVRFRAVSVAGDRTFV